MSETEKNVLFSNTPENEYSENVDIGHRKKYAQFFTPFPIASFMAKWVTSGENCHRILEPAFGLGIFSRILKKAETEKFEIRGFETDKLIIKEAEKIFKNSEGKYDIEISRQDYMQSDWEEKYDGVLCNPPYFKYHDYDNKAVLKETNRKLGTNLNGFTNLYTLFLLKSVYQLNDGGRAAYIVPSEFMNSGYGKEVKSFLLKSGTLRYIVVFDFRGKVFDDALTTACILLLAKDKHHREIRFVTVKTQEELNGLLGMTGAYPAVTDSEKAKTFKRNLANPDIKWRSYYQGTVTGKYKNLVPLSLYGKVVRGIATGDNRYFAFNREKQKRYAIKDENLVPCITKSNDISGLFFTKKDFEKLADENRNVFLIDLKKSQDEKVAEYIRLGEKKGVHKKYLTSKRNPWYALENRSAPAIWVSVFNRKGPRFVRNEAGVRNLTTFHCFYLDICKTDLLFAYFLTDISKEIISDNRREYGNGLNKFEPNDLNHAKIFDLNAADREIKSEILKNYGKFRKAEIRGVGGGRYTNALNGIFERLLKK